MATNDNIIYAKFNHSKEIRTEQRYQYAYGQVLEISGLELPDQFDADVSNDGDDSTKTVVGTDSLLSVPDEYFLTGKDIIVMINVHATSDDGRTKYVIRIPIVERPEKSDEEITPVEQDTISQTIALLNEAVSQTETNVSHYPKIENGTWWVWDATESEWVDTEIEATGEKGDTGDTGTAIYLDVDCNGLLIPTDSDLKLTSDFSQDVTLTLVNAKWKTIGVTRIVYNSSTGTPSTTSYISTSGSSGSKTFTFSIAKSKTLKAQNGTITASATDIDDNTYTITIPWAAVRDGEQGDAAVVLSVNTNGFIIPVDEDGVLTEDYTQTIKMSLANAKWKELSYDILTYKVNNIYTHLSLTLYSTGNSNPLTKTITIPSGATLVNKSGVATITAKDTDDNTYTTYFPWVSVSDGQDSLSIEIGTPSFVLPIDTSGNTIDSIDLATNISVKQGNEDVEFSINLPSGGGTIIYTLDNTGYALEWSFSDGFLSAQQIPEGVTPISTSGQIIFDVVVDGTAYTERIPWCIVKQGEQGETYDLTDDDKSEIAETVGEMFVVNVSGANPVIVANPNTRYVCGELTTLDFTPSTSGICDIIFTSGTTATVVNLHDTVMPSGFFVGAETKYEINIMDGLGVSQPWALS